MTQTRPIIFQAKAQQEAQQKQQKSSTNNAQITCQMNLAVKCTDPEKYQKSFFKTKNPENFFYFKK